MLITKAKNSGLLVCIIGLSFGSLALGQGVGPDGPFDTNHFLESIISTPEEKTYWKGSVGSVENRISLELDPQGPEWLKHFNTQGNSTILPGHRILITEHIVVDGIQQWTGWWEQIETPGFDWEHNDHMIPWGQIDADGLPAPGSTIDYITAVPPNGASIRFSFDPLPACTQIDIIKKVVYTGIEPFSGSITVSEFPIPEPTSGSLIILGALLRLVRRKK